MEGVGKGEGCHHWGTTLIGPAPFPITEPTFRPSALTTQPIRVEKTHLASRTRWQRRIHTTPAQRVHPNVELGIMVEKDLVVGEVGSSNMLPVLPGASARVDKLVNKSLDEGFGSVSRWTR